MPNRCTILGGNTLLAKARLKMASNCLSSPPIPRLSKLSVLALKSWVVAKPFCPMILMLALSDAVEQEGGAHARSALQWPDGGRIEERLIMLYWLLFDMWKHPFVRRWE